MPVAAETCRGERANPHPSPWLGDKGFKTLTLVMALAVFVLIILIGFELAEPCRLFSARSSRPPSPW